MHMLFKVVASATYKLPTRGGRCPSYITQLLPPLIQSLGVELGVHVYLHDFAFKIISDYPIKLLMTALYNAILPFSPSTKGNEKLVNEDKKLPSLNQLG